MRLIATKPLTYSNCRLVAGDEFEAAPGHARILIGIRKARDPQKRASVSLPPPPPEIAEQLAAAVEPDTDESMLSGAGLVADHVLDMLRQEAASLGIEVDGRWGPRRLQQKIDLFRNG